MRLLVSVLLITFSLPAMAQSLAGSIGLFVYPPEDKTTSQREQDDYQCYNWAKSETGFDPMKNNEPREVVSDNKAQAGSGAQGALRGAARGAVLGEILDDDAGKGAAIGALAGGLFGGIRRSNRRAEEQRWQQQQAQQAQMHQQQQAQQQQQARNNFNRAYGVCMSSRNYKVQ